MENGMRRTETEESRMTPGLQVISREEETAGEETRPVRVAAYCRVSTDLALQQSSLDLQMESYGRTIEAHPGWVLAGIYADRGASGTTVKGRSEFMRMMKDAEEGRIDRIIAKSISRFARNTVDALTWTRKLRAMGIGVWFEEQNLDSLDIQSEMLLTVHSAFAQEESHSISENMKRGIRQRFAMGIPRWTYTYGLMKAPDGEWVPDPETAPVVERIFRLALEGLTSTGIAETLNGEGVPSAQKRKWFPYTISSILHNEKYIGDVAMQKGYTADHLSHRRVNNDDAKVTRYYRKDHHEAIISREDFALVQKILAMRTTQTGYSQYPYSGFLKCPYCGEDMVAVMLPSRFHTRALTCGGKGPAGRRPERTGCPEFFVPLPSLDDAVLRGFHEIDPVLANELAKKRTKAGIRLKDWRMRNPDEVSFLFLHELVDCMTFKSENGIINWNKLVISWAAGFVTETEVRYSSALETPVTRADIWMDGDVMRINGCPLTGTSSTWRSVNDYLNFCRELVIEDMPDIEVCGTAPLMSSPSVIGPNSRRADGRKDG